MCEDLADKVKNDVLSWIRFLPEPDFTTTAGERGVVTGLMNKALTLDESTKMANVRRYMALAWLFGDYINRGVATRLSSKLLPDECWWALCMYVDAHKDEETGAYVSGRDAFAEEMIACWQAMESWEDGLLRSLAMDRDF